MISRLPRYLVGLTSSTRCGCSGINLPGILKIDNGTKADMGSSQTFALSLARFWSVTHAVVGGAQVRAALNDRNWFTWLIVVIPFGKLLFVRESMIDEIG